MQEISNINATFFVSKDTHYMTHPNLQSTVDDIRKWTHLIYFSGQPNKCSAFTMPVIKSILSKPNFFYKNHNHYYLLPSESPQQYLTGLESVFEDVCKKYIKSCPDFYDAKKLA